MTKSDFSIGTGGSVRTKGKFGIRHQLGKMKSAKRSTYSNLSSKDLDYFADEVISPRARSIGRGKGFSRYAKKGMKSQVSKDFKSGRISREDAKDFKKIIDSL